MKKTYLIADINNSYYLKDGFKGFNVDSLQNNTEKMVNLNKYNEEEIVKQKEIDSYFIMNNKGNFTFLRKKINSINTKIFHVVTHPITVQKYETVEMFILNNGTSFFVLENSYAKETGMTLITVEGITYVASLDEIKYFSIPVFSFKDEDIIYCPFKLMIHKVGFWDEKLKTIFNTFDLDNVQQEKIIPLLGILKEFILLQEEFVFPYFLSNILNILVDAKKMLNSDLSQNDKNELMKETILTMEKLKVSINDVSPFQYEKVCSLETCISEYYEKERNEKEKEEMQKRKIEREKKEKNKLLKNNYLENIKAKSELLDYFNLELKKLS